MEEVVELPETRCEKKIINAINGEQEEKKN